MRVVFAVILGALACLVAAPAESCTPEPRSMWRSAWGQDTCGYLRRHGGAVRGTVVLQSSWSRRVYAGLGTWAPAFLWPHVDRSQRWVLKVEERWGPAVPTQLEIVSINAGGCTPIDPSWFADGDEAIVFGQFVGRGPHVVDPFFAVGPGEVEPIAAILGPGVRPSALPNQARRALGRLGVLSLLSVFCWWWFALGVRARVRGVRGH